VVDARDPSVVYAATFRGLYKSVDYGETWSATSLRLDDVEALVIDPSNPAILWAGTGGEGDNLFRSVDGGVIWTGSDIPPDAYSYSPVGGRITALAIDPVNPSIVYAGENTGIFKSSDGGATWSRSGYDGGVSCLVLDLARSETLYACFYGNVLKTEDAGASWSRVLSGSGSAVVALDSTHPETVYAGTGLRPSPEREAGLFKSTDGARTWGAVNEGMGTATVLALVADPTAPERLYTGLSSSADPLWRTVDGGESWNAASGVGFDIGVRSVSAIASTPSSDALFAASGFGIFKSADGGENWSGDAFQFGPTVIWTLAIDPLNPNLVYAGTFCCTTRAFVVGGVYRSSDQGTTWFFSAAGLREDASGRSIYSLVVDPIDGAVFAGTGAGLFKSPNGGISWVPSGLDGIQISSLRFDPLVSSTLYAGSYGGGVFKSTDRGTTWFPIIAGLTNMNVGAIEVDPIRRNTVYVGTYGGGIFRTTDGGASWFPFNEGLSNLYVTSLAISSLGGTIHAGTWGAGVFDFEFLPDRSVIPVNIRRPRPRFLTPRPAD
jgi:photosystem II stability/assembly factor-like uncharacterized protein